MLVSILFRKVIRAMAVAALFLSAAPLIAAQKAKDVPFAGIYKGTLGKQEIVLAIGRGPESGSSETEKPVSARYFYRKYRLSIALEVTEQDDGKFLLHESEPVNKPSVDSTDDVGGAEWLLAFKGENATGEFCRCELTAPPDHDHPRLNISLTRVAKGLKERDLFFDLDSGWVNQTLTHPVYDQLLLDVPLKISPEVHVSPDVAYVTKTDPGLKVTSLHFTRLPNSAAMAKINAEQEILFTQARIAVSDCAAQGEAEESYHLQFLSAKLMDIMPRAFFYCGGAYPEGRDDERYYDLDTGEQVHPYALVMDDVDPAKVKRFRHKGVQPLDSLLSELYFSRYKSRPEDEGGCDDVVVRGPDGNPVNGFIQLDLANKGIEISLNIEEHATRGCGYPILVPYSEFFQYLKPNSHFAQMVKPVPGSKL